LSRARAILSSLWPRVAALGGLVLVWYLFYESGFFDPSVFPSPATVFDSLGDNLFGGLRPQDNLILATQKSLIRLFVGLGVGVILGTAIGVMMSASEGIRRGVGSLMTGLQALPSISWLPLAILWFGLNNGAVLFVVIIAAVPAVAIATEASIRLVPPLLVRAGRTLGAERLTLYRKVVIPAAIPSYVGGLHQSWAFAWRALMAGELIATGGVGLGMVQEVAREGFNAPLVMAVMVVIIIVGMSFDYLFGIADRRIRAKRGLVRTLA
jgi:NitT/TauT family transport system permease protein